MGIGVKLKHHFLGVSGEDALEEDLSKFYSSFTIMNHFSYQGVTMQTLTLDIQDNFIQEFLTIIEHYKDKIQLKKDKNLEYDPYFYHRQEQLQQDIKDIDSGKIQMLSQQQYDTEMNRFMEELKSKYIHYTRDTR
jgi:hypothetical protein